MKFTRGKRIALEVLGPPFLGAILMTTVFAAMAVAEALEKGEFRHRLEQVAQVTLMAVFVAYILAGIQSVLYALVMEWRFARGLDPRSWKSVGLSCTLGFLSGAVIVLPMGWGRQLLNPWLWLIYGGLGLLVGFALGLLIRRLSR